jgi:CheY-like chemotaxis protein
MPITSPSSLRPGRLLVVEDQPAVALVLQKTLESLGHSVVGVAACGEQAIALAEASPPDLALVDIELAGAMDGTRLATILRERLGVPSVFMSGHADQHTVERALGAEPMGYLVKPFDQRTLQLTIQLALSKHAEEQQRRASEEARARAEQAEAVAMLAARVAHEVNNLLAAISCNAHVLGSSAQLDAETIDESVADIAGAVERGAVLTRELLVLARAPRLLPAYNELAELARSTANLNHAAQLQQRVAAAPFDQQGAAVSAHAPPAPRGEVVLVVDDDPILCTVVSELLSQAGYRTLTATSPAEAFGVLAREPVAAIVSDLVMPEMTGQELCRRVLAQRPGLAVVYMSGDLVDVQPVSPGGPLPVVVYKPLLAKLILGALAEAIARRGA